MGNLQIFPVETIVTILGPVVIMGSLHRPDQSLGELTLWRAHRIGREPGGLDPSALLIISCAESTGLERGLEANHGDPVVCNAMPDRQQLPANPRLDADKLIKQSGRCVFVCLVGVELCMRKLPEPGPTTFLGPSHQQDAPIASNNY